MSTGKKLYEKSGVKDDQAEKLVDWLVAHKDSSSPSSVKTLDSLPKLGQVEEGIGGFASVFAPSFESLKEPLWVTATDGVGTKVLLALKWGMLEGIGEDLVAMCANDLLTLGARPLGFLDYYATSHLESHAFKQVIQSIRRGLEKCSCALVGGETAQMPGLYQKDHFDLAGFMFGVVDRSMMLGAHRIEDGDLIYALPSSGFHANGFSLLRQWIYKQEDDLSEEDKKAFLAPTKIYSELALLHAHLGTEVIHGAAHITGGGIATNLSRVLPPGATAHLSFSQLPISPWMKNILTTWGQRPWQEFQGVFNLGCGMMVAVSSHALHHPRWLSESERLGIEAHLVGKITYSQNSTQKSQVRFEDAPPSP